LEKGVEAAGQPVLKRAVLTDEQRDEIREAFDLYVVLLSCRCSTSFHLSCGLAVLFF